MDLQSQEAIARLAKTHAPSDLLVLLGAPDPEAAEIAAETVVLGDPAYAGALTEAQLGLDVYHVLEEAIREAIPEDVWEEQIGVMADILETDALAKAVASMREKKPENVG
jgi:betaine reductase